MTRTIAPALLALSCAAHGALTFNIDRIGPDAGGPNASAGAIGTGDDGTVNAIYSQSPLSIDGESSATLTVTLTSLTLDNIGADDDSAVLNFTVSSAGGTINHSTDLGVNGNGAGRLNDASETLTFSYTGGSITLGAGAAAGAVGIIDFIGFNQIELSQFTNDGLAPDDVASLTLGGGTPTDVTTDAFAFTADPGDMTVGFTAGDSPNDGFKLNHFRARFSLDVVPEPSVALTSALGLMALVLRRRR